MLPGSATCLARDCRLTDKSPFLSSHAPISNWPDQKPPLIVRSSLLYMNLLLLIHEHVLGHPGAPCCASHCPRPVRRRLGAPSWPACTSSSSASHTPRWLTSVRARRTHAYFGPMHSTQEHLNHRSRPIGHGSIPSTRSLSELALHKPNNAKSPRNGPSHNVERGRTTHDHIQATIRTLRPWCSRCTYKTWSPCATIQHFWQRTWIWGSYFQVRRASPTLGIVSGICYDERS
ncbi:hypothetical protein C8Q80DRAFT_852458 [Daedaleopsis nitida]|nr:hypothetical protein C8Q80DRAFT_852458 [Daedaleopsis nitida]